MSSISEGKTECNIGQEVEGQKRTFFACWKGSENSIPSKEINEADFLLSKWKEIIKTILNFNLDKKKLRLENSTIKEGRWDANEHEKFLKACFEFGEDWQKVKFI